MDPEPEKPFPCKVKSCRLSFATEDHLSVHQKTHELVLEKNFIVDKTPTPSRFLQNLAEVGLFEENIFEVTFRKANEEKSLQDGSGSGTTSLRRMISIQNEDTLHTPQIPLHFYKSDSVNSESQEATITTPLPPKKPSPEKPRKRRKPNPLDKINPPTTSVETGDTPPIPVAFPSAIQIKPKWAVVLQYPSFDPQLSAKERLKSLLIKNDSSKSHTITLGPQKEIITIPEAPPVPEISSKLPLPNNSTQPIKTIKEPSMLERNNAATKRYRNKKKNEHQNLLARNKELEEENRRLREENRNLNERLKKILERNKSPDGLL